MQTFLPYGDFRETVKVLDNKRLNKQKVECLQIIRTNLMGKYIYICRDCGCSVTNLEKNKIISNYCDSCKKIQTFNFYKMVPWINHPAVRMWRDGLGCLVRYSFEILEECKKRGFKDTLESKLKDYLYLTQTSPFAPSWLGNERLHSSHRQALLFKNFNWYSKFGWKEQPKYEYYWPV